MGEGNEDKIKEDMQEKTLLMKNVNPWNKGTGKKKMEIEDTSLPQDNLMWQ